MHKIQVLIAAVAVWAFAGQPTWSQQAAGGTSGAGGGAAGGAAAGGATPGAVGGAGAATGQPGIQPGAQQGVQPGAQQGTNPGFAPGGNGQNPSFQPQANPNQANPNQANPNAQPNSNQTGNPPARPRVNPEDMNPLEGTVDPKDDSNRTDNSNSNRSRDVDSQNPFQPGRSVSDNDRMRSEFGQGQADREGMTRQQRREQLRRLDGEQTFRRGQTGLNGVNDQEFQNQGIQNRNDSRFQNREEFGEGRTNSEGMIRQQRRDQLRRLDQDQTFRRGQTGLNGVDDQEFGNQGIQNRNDSRFPNRDDRTNRDAMNNPDDMGFDREAAIDRLQQGGVTADPWRVVEHEGRLWYWGPNDSWMYYNNGDWFSMDDNGQAGGFQNRYNPYSRSDLAFPTGYPSENWRMVEHNGRWWYWSPQESWLYYNDNTWSPYQARAATMQQQRMGQRYRTGYRSDGSRGDLNGVDSGQTAEPANPYTRSPHTRAVEPNPSGSQRQTFEAQPRTEPTPSRSSMEAAPQSDAQMMRPQQTTRPQGMAPPTQQPQPPAEGAP